MLRVGVLVGACLFAAFALAAVMVDAGAWPMLAMAAVLLVGTVFERVNYRGSAHAERDGAAAWRRTDERFLDEATGEPVTVWYDPVTGARCYVSASEAPPR